MNRYVHEMPANPELAIQHSAHPARAFLSDRDRPDVAESMPLLSELQRVLHRSGTQAWPLQGLREGIVADLSLRPMDAGRV
jgi:hypothetical protein